MRPQMHGRDHRKGGADPIPGIGRIDYPLTQIMPLEGPWYRGDEWSRLRTTAVGPEFGGAYPLILNNYRESRFTGTVVDTRTAAIEDSFTWRFRLGPKNSWWGVIFSFEKGPGHGRVQIGWASVPEDTDDDVAALDVSSLNFIEGVSDIYEGYQVASGMDWGGIYAGIQPTGADGDEYTGSGGPGAAIDGGAGVYALRFRVYGKAGASSGYKAGIANLAVVRYDFVGTTAGQI